MRNFIKKRISLEFSPKSVPLSLLIVALLAYAPLFSQLGYYWDEFPWTWTYFQLGPRAMVQLFSTSRPFWGLIYQVSMPLVGPYPWRWQLLAVFLRWLTALLLWAILRQVWPKHPRPALWASLFFLVFPGFGEQFIAFMYTHFFLILSCFLFSLYLSLLAIRRPERYLLYTSAAILLAAVNLLTMEYFYFLEFFRLALFWVLLDDGKAKLKRVVKLYVPYFLLFAGISFWRAFFFKAQNLSYGYSTLTQLKTTPLAGVGTLVHLVVDAFWQTEPLSWASPFFPIDPATLGFLTTILTVGLTLVATLLIGLYLFRFTRADGETRSWIRVAFGLGFFGWLVAGGSFWLVGLQPKLDFPGDRFVLPFMLGSSLLLVGLLGCLARWPKVQYVLLALFIGFSVGRQFQIANAYRRDWDTQKEMFWQMSQRIPSMQPHTTLVSNDLPFTFYSDNSLTGPLNWVYGPKGEMQYILYFASVRVGRAISAWQPDLPIRQYYLSATFYGNTSQIVAFDFEPPNCLRVLDPQIDPLNRLLPPDLRDAAFLSDPALIETTGSPHLPPQLYGSQPAQNFCTYFEQAELAGQQGKWAQAVKLGQQAFALDDHPGDPLDRFVFIEAYAHTGDWKNAARQTDTAYKFSPEFMRPTLCQLWTRIDHQVPDSPAKQSAVASERETLQCSTSK